jgi:hypothetical protein
MKYTSILILFLLGIFLAQCTNKYKKSATLDPKKTEEAVVIRDTTVISFVSFGSGIDRVAYKKLLADIEQHETKYNVKLLYKIESWGREGEKNVYFPMQDSKEFNVFLQEAIRNVEGHERVKVKKTGK